MFSLLRTPSGTVRASSGSLLVVMTVVVVLSFNSRSLQAAPMGWSASSGVFPWDASIPLTERFSQTGPTSVFSMVGTSHMHVDSTAKVKVQKLDAPTIGSEFAFEVVLRTIIGDRSPSLDWADAVGMSGNGRNATLLISRTRVGFTGVNSDSFINNQSYALDTTDNFHTFRVEKTAANLVKLYIDSGTSPVLSLSASDWLATASNEVVLSGTSASGRQAFDISRFSFNPSGLQVPEPSAVSLLAVGFIALLRRGSRQRT